MSFSPAFLDELRLRLPLSSVAMHKIKLTRAGREYKACCPFHDEKTPSFYINDEKQFYHCFGCGAHGDVISLTMRLEGLSFPEAIELLAQKAGLEVPNDTPKERQRYDREKQLYLLLDAATQWFEEQLRSPAGREARAYLESRGLAGEALSRHRLGFAPQDSQALLRRLGELGFSAEDMLAVGLVKKNEERGEIFSFFRNRVMFPVGDRRGRTVAFGGRVMGDGEPKYLNSPDHVLFHKGHLLYGLSRARAALDKDQPLIVVEGYMDVIALVEAGFIGAVAPLGTALTEDQLTLLWRLLPPLEARKPERDYSPILCFDGDNAGLRAAARAADRALPLLSAADTIRIATITGAKDPDELLKKAGRSAMQDIFDRARPMIDIVWEFTAQGRPLQTPEDRASFMQALRRKIAQIRDERLRRLYEDEIKKRLAATFHWGERPARGRKDRQGSSSFSYKKGAFKLSPLVGKAPHRPLNPENLRERILLALMINYPVLFDEYGEDLGRLTLSSPSLEALRQRLLEIYATSLHETLDVEALYRHLSLGDKGLACRKALGEVLSETTYMHAGFARPERSPDLARQGWKSIWNKHLQELLQTDIEDAKHRYATDATDANLKRLIALRDQMEALIRESAALSPDEDRLFLQN